MMPVSLAFMRSLAVQCALDRTRDVRWRAMQGTVSMRLPMRMTVPVPSALPSKDGKAQGTGRVILMGNLIETVPCIARHLTS